MSFIDFHVHIDYYKDFNEKFNFYNKNKIYALCVTNLPEIYEKCIDNFNKSKYVQFALGYNPQFSSTDKFSRKKFDEYLDTTKYIGEVGLDFSKDFIIHKAEQIKAFDYIAQMSGQYNKIMSIHSKSAENEVISILKKNKVKFAVFHWYTGKVEKVKEIVDMGYYFSVNSKMLQSKRGLTIIKNIPLERILIETDGPFTDFREEEITPDKLPEVYSTFEQVLKIRKFKGIVFCNLKKLLTNQQHCIR